MSSTEKTDAPAVLALEQALYEVALQTEEDYWRETHDERPICATSDCGACPSCHLAARHGVLEGHLQRGFFLEQARALDCVLRATGWAYQQVIPETDDHHEHVHVNFAPKGMVEKLNNHIMSRALDVNPWHGDRAHTRIDASTMRQIEEQVAGAFAVPPHSEGPPPPVTPQFIEEMDVDGETLTYKLKYGSEERTTRVGVQTLHEAGAHNSRLMVEDWINRTLVELKAGQYVPLKATLGVLSALFLDWSGD